jgi:NRAMP (natural resistance-associated macrophage protein)-like metal ion transporter
LESTIIFIIFKSRNVDRRHESSIKEANIYYAIESGCALLLAFIVNLFVTSVSAKSLHDTPLASNITLFNADQFIQSQYGLTTVIIWAIGLLSAGQCSTITGTYAGQFIMEVSLNFIISKSK